MNSVSLFEFDDRPFALERELKKQGFSYVAGVDEVGRGALAGPVVAASVIMNSTAEVLINRVKDSKKLAPQQRETLFPLIHQHALAIGIGMIESYEIDEINILKATLKAMKSAVEKLDPAPQIVLVDGKIALSVSIPQRVIVKGDDRVFSIGAASIIAKVTRDRLMAELASRYPLYGFDKNKGYGTSNHLKALSQYGPCELHRKSFQLPVC